jgi:hypothetical protein
MPQPQFGIVARADRDVDWQNFRKLIYQAIPFVQKTVGLVDATIR